VTAYVEPAAYLHVAPGLLLPVACDSTRVAAREPGAAAQGSHQRPPGTLCAPMGGASGAVAGQAVGDVLTWPEGRCPNNSLPDEVAQCLDFVVVLGGDGTLLWTCHIFGNRAIPPLLPFAMGSLGFLTPFKPDGLGRMLRRVVAGG
jgi:hypothetical protein